MKENLEVAKKILKKYNQEHLLNFYDELDDEKKSHLINQICNIDFKQIFDLYEASKIDEVIPTNSIEPLKYTEKYCLTHDESLYFSLIGEDIVKQNRLAVVTMAGGQRNKTWL